jgi:hypothetical protein
MARACVSQSLCRGVFSAANDTVRDPPSRKHTEARLAFEWTGSSSGTKTLGRFEFDREKLYGWTAGVATRNPPTRRHDEPHATRTSSTPQSAR